MKIQFFMKNGPRIHEKSFSTQKAIKRSSFCSILKGLHFVQFSMKIE